MCACAHVCLYIRALQVVRCRRKYARESADSTGVVGQGLKQQCWPACAAAGRCLNLLAQPPEMPQLAAQQHAPLW